MVDLPTRAGAPTSHLVIAGPADPPWVEDFVLIDWSGAETLLPTVDQSSVVTAISRAGRFLAALEASTDRRWVQFAASRADQTWDPALKLTDLPLSLPERALLWTAAAEGRFRVESPLWAAWSSVVADRTHEPPWIWA